MVFESLPRTVRILLLGEPGVGKTSLILSLVTEEFTEHVPPKAEEITIPADVTPEQVPTNIVDICVSEQSLEQVGEEIEKAHVICIVFSVDRQDTLNKIASYWLPFVRENCSLDCRKPVILVGNKIDLIDYSVIDNIWDVAEEYPEVDRCIECSAKTLTNVSEMFYNAQKAVLHPIGPIYSIEEQELTEKCKKALSRIFKICDLDGDGLLDDYEITIFQRKCFDTPLQLQVLDEVKSVIAQNIAGGIENECITMKGFIFLHCLFIQRGRNETTWTVLRKFGYDETLELTQNYLYANIKIPVGCTSELSYKGQQFLTQLFEKYDRDKDGMLNPTELKNVFSCCPRIPWHNLRYTVPTNEKGYLTLQGWMCRWTLMTLVDLQNTSAYFAYLGFNYLENESQRAAIHITREKKVDIAKKQSSRNVYQCHIIGPRLCGKTSICRSFLGIAHKKIKPQSQERGDCNPADCYCINTVLVYGQEKYLVLKEIAITRVSDPLQPQEVNCDVACLVYDTAASRSFEYIARIYIVPDRKEWEDIQVGFHHRWNFPGCCGAIDGKHVVIQAPPNSGSEYYNYKGTNSLVLLAVVDHDYCFKYVDIGSYGRNSDGGVFQASSLYPLLENGSLLPHGGILVGDDAFPLKTYLLKRYPKQSTTAEKIYNYRLSRARRIVENGFGILASRFRVLGKPIQLNEETIIKIIRTTCVMHNWLRKSSPHTYTPPGSIDYEDIVNFTVVLGTWRSEINALPSIVRSRTNNRSKAVAEKVRENYKNYFCNEGAVSWQNNMIN